uniref:LegC family aminotransferase n=1 Tax=Ignisphaera aggregans TaxID=334771 RepID=A0A7C5XID6_9CREN
MFESKFKRIVSFIKDLYKKEIVPLHEPVFIGNEEKYVLDAIRSTFVSSLGEYVSRVEAFLSGFTGAKYSVVTVNGTAALHIALLLAGVERDTEVVTQPLSFVATCNAISYLGAYPTFVDIEKETLGMSPTALQEFLSECCIFKDGVVYNKITKRKISAIVPVHTFGHPCRIDEIMKIAQMYNIPVVEDAAEALGSFYKGKHVGTFGKLGIISFNGNKIVTSGGGGVILTSDEELARRAKHLTTTAKVPHNWEYFHDEVGYNYRMPNINAALLLAQLENLEKFIIIKRELAMCYKDFFDKLDIEFFTEPPNARSNYWLNAIFWENKLIRDKFLEYSHANGVLCRPAWVLMNKLPMYRNCFSYNIKIAYEIEDKLVNIPSGVIIER